MRCLPDRRHIFVEEGRSPSDYHPGAQAGSRPGPLPSHSI
nr:MAG TPA: hypothetical protein [Caudoviricetes sp.]